MRNEERDQREGGTKRKCAKKGKYERRIARRGEGRTAGRNM